MNKLIFKGVFFIIILFISCKKDTPVEVANPGTSFSNGGGIFVVNEGNFRFGNAKISYFDFGTNQVTEDLFKPANQFSLGDVCQSMYIFNNKIYLVVNNSGKVVVVNPTNFKEIVTIKNLASPRYFLPITNQKAYVTDLQQDGISIVDLNTNELIGKIPLKGWTEQLLLLYGKAFVTNQTKEKLYVVDTKNDILEDSIQVGYASNSIQQDKNGALWVLCSGDSSLQKKATLTRVNPTNRQVEQTFSFSSKADSPFRLCMNQTKDTLYFLNNDVFRLSINDLQLPSQPFINRQTRNFYGLGINPFTNEIFVADAIDYTQKGKIYRYTPSGNLIATFLAGIIPNDFYFKN